MYLCKELVTIDVAVVVFVEPLKGPSQALKLLCALELLTFTLASFPLL